MTNSSVDIVKRRNCPNRSVNQPVSGTAMALATANDVITHVPWLELTPRSPEIAGMETFAIDVSSTIMNVAVDSAIVPATSCAPDSGGGAADACGAAAGSAASSAVVVVAMGGGQNKAIIGPPIKAAGVRRVRPETLAARGIARVPAVTYFVTQRLAPHV